ncbi:hypothetical protein GCM10009639_45490 [Kitasatospora putterlickiae]|uniref:Secreted protein n=1 Tax=Kitasatospora putterlickiae TaxID=221725 RepID=A0ABN1YAB0_9ACTN
MVDSIPIDEPDLLIEGARPLFFARRGFRRRVIPLLAVLVTVTTVLALTGNLRPPGLPVVELKGRVASKSAFFRDPEVQRLLIGHRIKVTVDTAGSREIALGDLTKYDFVLPSGQPAADHIKAVREAAGEHSVIRLPFTSPIVVAAFRPYAEALARNHAARPHLDPASPEPLYYTLVMDEFLKLMRARTTWNDLDIGMDNLVNGDAVTAYTSNFCESNSSDTFLSQVAYTASKPDVPTDPAGLEELGRLIKPMLDFQGHPDSDRFESFVNSNTSVPTPVVYEHQFLDYQLRWKAKNGTPDPRRVLLYPDNSFVTAPRIISLKPRADELADLLDKDPGLQRRATELGFQVGLDSQGRSRLEEHLRAAGLPVPPADNQSRTAPFPPAALETLLHTVAGCTPYTS